MQDRKSRYLVSMFLLVASIFAGHVFNASALNWTGLSTLTNLWSDTSNWAPTQPLTFDNQAIFGDAGATNVLGAVNNVVDADHVLTNLAYSALFNGPTAAFNFDTTLLNPGVTLTVRSSNSTFMYVGTGVDNGAAATNYMTILGSGRLVLGDPASPSTYSNGFLQVKQASATSGNHRAVLDMSGLDTFTFAAGKFLVAANGTFGGAGDRVQGSVILAKTNVITCSAPFVTDPSEYLNEQPFTIGQSQGSQSAATFTNVVLLGQENTINADYLRIAGLKMNAQISFRPGLINPTLKLRAADGVSRVPRIVVGDATEARVVSFNCRGHLDLRGTVDALVQDMFIGKNGWRGPADGGAGDNTGGALGVMTLAGGTFDVTTLSIGCQQGDNAGTATGTVNVFTNATLVVGNLNIGSEAGTAGAGTGNGRLFINGGLVKVSGNLVENNAPGANGSSLLVITNNGTLNMMPLGDTVPGDITVDTLTIGSATLTNYGTLGLSTLNVLVPATEFTVYPGQALAPVAPGAVGTLTVNGNLTLASGKLRLDLNAPGVNDLINVTGILTLGGLNTVDVSAAGGTITPGSYTVMSYATGLVGDTNNLQVTGALGNSRYTFVFDTNTVPLVNLTVGGGPASSLTWSGDGSANLWDLHTTTNWNSHTERFYDLDTVAFDDAGSTSPAVSLVGTLEPAGVVTVNSAHNYTFSGSGKISGSAGLTKSGTGSLTVATTNDYTGDTTINAGAVLVNGALGNTTVNVLGGTLGGSGTILGPVSVQSGGVFAPGASIGTLTISNNLVLADGSTSVFEANMDTLAYDRVVGLTKVTCGGTLSLVLSGRPVAVTDTFKLFSATTVATAFSSPYGGAFSSILPATPGPAGLAWNTNSLPIDGTLRVVSTATTSMTLQQSGDQFTLSWPADHVGWRLQRQVNPPGVGLTANWVDVSGSTTTSSVTVTVNPANGSVFYRLVFP